MTRLLVTGLIALAVLGCDGGTKGSEGKAGNDKPDLYMRVENMMFGGRLSLDVQFFLMTPDGKFYQGVPIGGPDRFDWDKARKERPKMTGTYTINGDKITFKYTEGKEQTRDYKKEGDGFLLDGLLAAKLASFEDGKRLDGAWGGGAMAGAGTGTVVSAAWTWTLKKDGTYTRSSIGGFSADIRGGSVGGSSSGADSGTYKISGQTLELTHKDGTTTRHTIFPYDMGKGEIWLGIDSGPMRPEKK